MNHSKLFYLFLSFFIERMLFNNPKEQGIKSFPKKLSLMLFIYYKKFIKRINLMKTITFFNPQELTNLITLLNRVKQELKQLNGLINV
jgi:hypothetical protein